MTVWWRKKYGNKTEERGSELINISRDNKKRNLKNIHSIGI